MIPVSLASPPADFDERVRQKGLDAIAELVGEKTKTVRTGPKRGKIADHRDQIPAEKFPPYWRAVLPDMLVGYRRICAYLALYIEHATGSPSVDHVIPKSKSWDKVYEWSNYRLACALVNSCKNDVELALDPLDPLEIHEEFFALEFIEFQVVPGAAAKGPLLAQVTDTIKTLHLNWPECCKARREYVVSYEDRHIDFPYLKRRAPFIAQEMRRQARLHPDDG